MALGDAYVSLAELKRRFHIDDTEDDAELQLAISTAQSDVDDFCGRQFNVATAASARQFVAGKNSRLIVDDFSTTAGLVVKTGTVSDGFNTTLTINEDFIVEPIGGRIGEVDYGVYWRLVAIDHAWDISYHGEPSVEIEAVWGWSSVPLAIKSATLMQAARLYRRKDTPEGVLNGFEGAPIRVGYMLDPDIARSVKKFRKHVPGVF